MCPNLPDVRIYPTVPYIYITMYYNYDFSLQENSPQCCTSDLCLDDPDVGVLYRDVVSCNLRYIVIAQYFNS